MKELYQFATGMPWFLLKTSKVNEILVNKSLSCNKLEKANKSLECCLDSR